MIELAEVWRRGGAEVIARELGLSPRRKGDKIECKCPACGAPECWIGLRTEIPAFVCNRKNKCGKTESVWMAFIRHAGGHNRAVASVEQLIGKAAPEEPRSPPTRPPRQQVEALWSASTPLAQRDAKPDEPPPHALREEWELLRAKGADPIAVATFGLAKRTPPRTYRYPVWWPRDWTDRWSILLRLWEPDGTIAALHARSRNLEDEPKTRHPLSLDGRFGYGGLVFADTPGVALLRGELDPRELGGVLIVEGATDFLRAASSAFVGRMRMPVLGIVSGSESAFERIRWPSGLRCYVATDPDRAGDIYAERIAIALKGHEVLRMKAEAFCG